MPNKHTTTITVWDPLIRIFHWLLAGAFLLAWFVEDERMQLHLIAGGTVAGLLLFRLVWGFTGTPFSRFRDFLYPPDEILAHLRGLLHLKASAHMGHTPAGSAMIFILLGTLMLLVASGLLLYGAQEARGPLAGIAGQPSLSMIYAMERIHALLADGIALLVLLHVGGVVVESWLQKQNLAIAMVTGRKKINIDKESS